MCGICGTINNEHPVSDVTLRHMCATMTYRGPDEEGYLIRGSIGLGMRRLKIIDLSTGSQPIYNETGDIGIVFNGEIYNFKELRQDLEKAGHVFRTQSDTEVIIHGYESYGVGILERLNGMFAFALWDENEKRLLLGRDRAGQKPLFYYHKPDGDLIFASEIKVLLASGDVPQQVNDEAIYHYLSTQYIMGPETILKDVYQLPAAHYAIWHNTEFNVSPYWEPVFEPKEHLNDADWISHTRETVSDAVSRHMISDVPIGAYLSGGVDSSVIVALMSQQAEGRVKTFSIGFDVTEYSETDHARRIAERFGTDHHEFIVTAEQITSTLPQVVYHADQPLADTSLMATYLLAKMTRGFVTVALTGDGGDEVFAGYTRYTLDRLLRIYRILPEVMRTQWIPSIAGLLPERTDIPTDRNIVAGLKRLAQASTTTHKASILAWGSFFTEEQKQQLSSKAWLDCVGQHSTPDILAEIYDKAHAANRLDKTLAVDFITYLQDDLMVKADRMSMAHSLETRAPFLDNEVLALGQHMPQRLRIRGTTQKAILRDAFKAELPSENVKRIKRGFGMPVASWLRGHMGGYVRDVLLDKHTLSRGYFRKEAVEDLITSHQNGIADHGQRLWALLVLELWHRQFMDEGISKPH